VVLIYYFSFGRENILKTAKALVEDTKTLVAGAASNQEQLAVAAQCAVKTITRLADVVKLGAASLGSAQPEAQVSLETTTILIYTAFSIQLNILQMTINKCSE
jgi:hypothetical protein